MNGDARTFDLQRSPLNSNHSFTAARWMLNDNVLVNGVHNLRRSREKAWRDGCRACRSIGTSATLQPDVVCPNCERGRRLCAA